MAHTRLQRLGLILPVLAALAGCADKPACFASQTAVYCYRTLAGAECVPEPEPGAKRRLIGAGLSGPIIQCCNPKGVTREECAALRG